MALVSTAPEQAVVAFRRLLKEAGAGEQARVDALVALLQRLVWTVMFPGQRDGIRTVVNSSRERALPVFTGTDTLSEAAVRLGWVDPQGTVEVREMTAREALRRAVASQVDFLVVDLGAETMMEFTRAEVEALLALPEAEFAGPYGGTRDSEQNIRHAVRHSSQPPAGGRGSFLSPLPSRGASTGVRRTGRPEAGGGSEWPLARAVLRPPPVPVGIPGLSPTAFDAAGERGAAAAEGPGSGASDPGEPPTVELSPTGLAELVASMRPEPAPARSRDSTSAGTALAAVARRSSRPPPATRGVPPPMHDVFALPTEAGGDRSAGWLLSDELLDAVALSLRQYPEVEWACALTDSGGVPSVGLRVDAAFLRRVTEISDAVVDTAARHGAELSVTIINSPTEVRRARQVGTVFFPGRKRARLPS